MSLSIYSSVWRSSLGSRHQYVGPSTGMRGMPGCTWNSTPVDTLLQAAHLSTDVLPTAKRPWDHRHHRQRVRRPAPGTYDGASPTQHAHGGQLASRFMPPIDQ